MAITSFWLCFVPLFVAVDAIGTLPIFIGLSQGLAPRRVTFVLVESILTAIAVAVAFLLGGSWVLQWLGITVADFMVAGGIVLFVVALQDVLGQEKTRRRFDPADLGAVPLGVPLISGPAVLTTGLLLMKQHGIGPTVAALVVNILLAGVLFRFSGAVNRVLGRTGARVLSKIAALFLAAIAVMLVRKGLVQIVADAVRQSG